QRIVDQPVKVLKSIPGLELAPLQGYETCCGGAGIYNLLNPELSGQILAKKIENIRQSGAEVVVTSNPGCLLQIGAGLLIDGAKVRVVQLVDLLDAAYSGRGDSVG
ncbi:MAG: heterodisulfide reductase-related iron-sulfur binding cluster, partial [Blastocatellia bacterium]